MWKSHTKPDQISTIWNEKKSITIYSISSIECSVQPSYVYIKIDIQSINSCFETSGSDLIFFISLLF